MRFGLFYQIQVPKPWTPESESRRFMDVLEQAVYAEEMGFESLWFSEHHFRPEWSHNSAPDLTLAAISQRTTRMRLGVAVVLVPIHHPLHVAQRMATLDILSNGRVDLGVGRTGYPYQLTPYGTDIEHTRGLWEESLRIIPRAWTEETFSHDGRYYQIPPREVVPKPVQKPHPPIWSACMSEETARLTGEMGFGALVGTDAGVENVEKVTAIYKESIEGARPVGKFVNNHVAAMSTAFCHERKATAVERGTEIIGWYMQKQRERARLVWKDVDPATIPGDYRGYYQKDQRLANGPHPDDPTAREVVERGQPYCVGDPDDCIRFVEGYEAMGIEEFFPLVQIGPTSHQEVLNTIRLFGEHVIPHFKSKSRVSRPAASTVPSCGPHP